MRQWEVTTTADLTGDIPESQAMHLVLIKDQSDLMYKAPTEADRNDWIKKLKVFDPKNAKTEQPKSFANLKSKIANDPKLADSDKSGNTDNSANADRSAFGEKSAPAEKTAGEERAAKAEKLTLAENLIAADQAFKAEKFAQADKAEKAALAEKLALLYKWGQAEKSVVEAKSLASNKYGPSSETGKVVQASPNKRDALEVLAEQMVENNLAGQLSTRFDKINEPSYPPSVTTKLEPTNGTTGGSIHRPTNRAGAGKTPQDYTTLGGAIEDALKKEVNQAGGILAGKGTDLAKVPSTGQAEKRGKVTLINNCCFLYRS